HPASSALRMPLPGPPRPPASFPTRRSSDLAGVPLFVAYYRRALPRFEHVRRLLAGGELGEPVAVRLELGWQAPPGPEAAGWRWEDRKSTRLNSSHVKSSYAVFCLKNINKMK